MWFSPLPHAVQLCLLLAFPLNPSFSPRCLQRPQPPGKSSAQCLLHLEVTFLIGCSSLPASSLFNLEKSFPFRILLCAEAFYLGFFFVLEVNLFFQPSSFVSLARRQLNAPYHLGHLTSHYKITTYTCITFWLFVLCYVCVYSVYVCIHVHVYTHTCNVELRTWTHHRRHLGMVIF